MPNNFMMLCHALNNTQVNMRRPYPVEADGCRAMILSARRRDCNILFPHLFDMVIDV